VKPTDPDSPPHPADSVELKQKIAVDIAAHEHFSKLARQGKALYDDNTATSWPDDEWTRKARGEK
jgi:hypothetical protein